MNTDDIKKLSELARVGMSDTEMAALAGDFTNILAYIDQLNAVDTDGALPWYGTVTNRTRDDIAVSDTVTSHDMIMAGMPDSVDGFLKVPKIL